MSTITPDQLAQLKNIARKAHDHWEEMRALEREAYLITQEEDINGYTSDLIWQSDADVGLILESLDIQVEEVDPDDEGHSPSRNQGEGD